MSTPSITVSLPNMSTIEIWSSSMKKSIIKTSRLDHALELLFLVCRWFIILNQATFGFGQRAICVHRGSLVTISVNLRTLGVALETADFSCRSKLPYPTLKKSKLWFLKRPMIAFSSEDLQDAAIPRKINMRSAITLPSPSPCQV